MIYICRQHLIWYSITDNNLMRYFVCTNISGNDCLYKSMKQFELFEDVLFTMMFKISILCCALPVILGGPFTGQQHESNYITNTAFEFNVATPVSKFYWDCHIIPSIYVEIRVSISAERTCRKSGIRSRNSSSRHRG